jgi:phosphoribosylformylglycinamidine synthase
MRVYRCFTEKRPGFDIEAQGLRHDLRDFLGIKSLDAVRVFNRYDAEGITEDVYREARQSIFSEPQTDDCFDESMPAFDAQHWILGVEALPGQFDQRADSCAQCIQMLTCAERPNVKTAKFYVFFGALTSDEKARLRGYLINPVETQKAAVSKPETLLTVTAEPSPVEAVGGFIASDGEALEGILEDYGLAMDLDDLRFMQAYFRDAERRDPTVTELRVIDTYWSDHCRHTTFGTHLDTVEIGDGRVKKAYDLYQAARRELYGGALSKRPER